jgi:hypothetical protein
MAKRGTKAYNEEYLYIVYGISRTMKKVRSVWVQRNNVLVASGPDGTSARHAIKPGWTAEREAALVFGLTDTFMTPAALSDSEHTKKRLEELREKAASLAQDTQPPSEA